MTYQRLPYDDPASTTDMVSDCAEVGRTLQMTTREPAQVGAAAGSVEPAGSVFVPDTLARMAAGMHLHLT